MPRNRLSKRDVLVYALEGAQMQRGMWVSSGNVIDDDLYLDELDNDIDELQRRLAVIDNAELDKEQARGQ